MSSSSCWETNSPNLMICRRENEGWHMGVQMLLLAIKISYFFSKFTWNDSECLIDYSLVGNYFDPEHLTGESKKFLRDISLYSVDNFETEYLPFSSHNTRNYANFLLIHNVCELHFNIV